MKSVKKVKKSQYETERVTEPESCIRGIGFRFFFSRLDRMHPLRLVRSHSRIPLV